MTVLVPVQLVSIVTVLLSYKTFWKLPCFFWGTEQTKQRIIMNNAREVSVCLRHSTFQIQQCCKSGCIWEIRVWPSKHLLGIASLLIDFGWTTCRPDFRWLFWRTQCRGGSAQEAFSPLPSVLAMEGVEIIVLPVLAEIHWLPFLHPSGDTTCSWWSKQEAEWKLNGHFPLDFNGNWIGPLSQCKASVRH